MFMVVPLKYGRKAAEESWSKENQAPEYWAWLWLQNEWREGRKPTVQAFADAAGWSIGRSHRMIVKVRTVVGGA